jgi:streptogramin lyase
VAALLVTSTAVVVVGGAPAGATACTSHLLHPSNVAQPTSIVTGPDGNLWFTSSANDRIGRIDPDTLQVATFTLGGALEPVGIVAGPDGNLWFTAYGSSHIGRITPSGTVTLYTSAFLDGPQGIAVSDDGRIWFASTDNDRVGKLNPLADPTNIVTFPTGGAVGAEGPLDITPGPGATMWFSAVFALPAFSGRIGRIGEDGLGATSFQSPVLAVPGGMTEGPDGNLWATSLFNGTLVKVTPAGAITGFTAPDVVLPQRITTGPDGALWFAPDNFPGRVGRITAAGDITTYSAGGNEGATDVETGPDGNIWFVGQYDDTVGYVDPDDPGPRFSDITSTHPFCEEIGWMDEQAISAGYEDRSFRPGDAVTRASMSAFLYRLAGEPAFTPPVSPSFSDVSTSHPFFLEVEWMSDEGITTGYANGTYRPSAAVTRQSMSAFMLRMADPDPPFVPPASATFDDVSTSHPFFVEIEWMAAEAITNGYADGTFKPAAVVTRQAMSAFMYRLDALLTP